MQPKLYEQIVVAYSYSSSCCRLLAGVDQSAGAVLRVHDRERALLAGLEGGGVVQLAAHVQREGLPLCVQREGVHLHQREVQVQEHLPQPGPGMTTAVQSSSVPTHTMLRLGTTHGSEELEGQRQRQEETTGAARHVPWDAERWLSACDAGLVEEAVPCMSSIITG